LENSARYVAYKTNACLRFANPGQLEFAIHPEAAGVLEDVELEIDDAWRVEDPRLDAEIIGATGLLVAVGRGLGLYLDVAKDFVLTNTGEMGALSPMFTEPSQLQAFALPDECPWTPASRDNTAIATVTGFDCIFFFSDPIPKSVDLQLVKGFVSVSVERERSHGQ